MHQRHCRSASHRPHLSVYSLFEGRILASRNAEAAYYLDVSLSTLYRMVKEAKLTPIRLGGKTVRFSKEDMDRLLCSGKQNS